MDSAREFSKQLKCNMRDYFAQWHPQEIWKFSLLNLVKTFKVKRPNILWPKLVDISDGHSQNTKQQEKLT